MQDGVYDVSGDAYNQEAALSEQHKTTYGCMNDWMGVQDRVVSSNVPITMSDSNWMKKSMLTDQKPKLSDKYARAYTDLTQQIAYRYPNPGKARERQGRIGGSWRHIKEVLGHGGSRVVFVDGKNDRIPPSPRVYQNQGGREGRSGGHWRNVTEVQGHGVSQVCFVNTPRDVEIAGELNSPRSGRTGRAGGAWKHMTEVVGHGGNQVMFVDGLVGTYDSHKFTDELCERQSARPHLNDVYVPSSYNLTTTQIPDYDPLKTARLPTIPDATPRYYDEDVQRKMALLADDKYKGFYKYK